VVSAPPSLEHPLHADEWKLAEPGRAIVCRSDGTMRPSWKPYGGPPYRVVNAQLFMIGVPCIS
jgi:hypothetical protein